MLLVLFNQNIKNRKPQALNGLSSFRIKCSVTIYTHTHTHKHRHKHTRVGNPLAVIHITLKWLSSRWATSDRELH